MSSLFRDLNHAAIDAKLNRNEFMIFNALMSQTLGYGKCDDPLTDKRIAKLTDIRLDRLRPTLARFVKRGIFERRPHDRYQYEYFIPDRFFDDLDDKKVYTPHCANSGETHPAPSDLTANGGEKPAERGHTVTNQTQIHKKPPQQTTETENTFTKKTPPPQKTETDLKKPPPPKTPALIEIFVDGELPEHLVIQSTEAVRIEFSTKQKTQTATVADTNTTTVATPTEPIETTIEKPLTPQPDPIPQTPSTTPSIVDDEPLQIEPEPTTPITSNIVDDEPLQIEPELTTPITSNIVDDEPLQIEPEPMTPSIVDDKPLHIEPEPELEPESETATEPTVQDLQQPVVVVEEKEGKNGESNKSLTIPKAVGESNQKACHNHFDWLSTKQKQDVLLVFYTMLKTGTIRNTANYFIGLCKLAKTDDLTLPTEVTSKKKRSAKQIAKQQEEEKRRNLWSDYVCIQQFAQREQVAEKVIAERFEMMEAYEMFGQEKQPLAA